MLDFYKNKVVLVTGHTGFKGSWMCKTLINLGAKVIGFAENPPTTPSLYNLSHNEKHMTSIIGDIRDLQKLKQVFHNEKPEIVFHLAAQPLVLNSYENPVYTYETNVMGTVNICECVRCCNTVKSFVNVTTDKVYKNNEWAWGYRETDALNGQDPYSNSKSCSELVTSSFKHSFFNELEIAVSTVRGGNVIGGGDFSDNRIIPDCIKAAINHETIVVRNPNSIRPYQHVLELVYGYLLVAEKQYYNIKYGDAYNIGPNDSDCITTGELVDVFCKHWGEDTHWINVSKEQPHEANFLKLDSSKIRERFQLYPVWNIDQSINKVVEWSKIYKNDNNNIIDCMDNQLNEFLNWRNYEIKS